MNITKYIFKFTTFVVVAIIASLFLIEAQRTYSYNKTIEQIPQIDISITPTPISVTSTSQMPSPEGSKLLTLETVESNNTSTNSIKIIEINTNPPKEILIKSGVNETLQIPFNTWSPDTFYFFLKGEEEYYVFQSSGDAFPSGEQYITVSSLFKDQMSTYTIDQITGWADNTLLVINTKEKISFWFDVPSRSFIQLGNYFE